GHPILELGLDRVKPQTTFGYRNKQCGPRFLNALIADHRDEILLVEPSTLKRYAIHHSHRTYADREALSLEVGKEKLERQAADRSGGGEWEGKRVGGRPCGARDHLSVAVRRGRNT